MYKPKFVTLRDNEYCEVRTHAVSNIGDYGTLCGLSDTDDLHTVLRPTRSKIDCENCQRIFENCQRYSTKDFAKQT